MSKELIPLVEFCAQKYDVNPIWIRAIIKQESNWEIFALRFEPDYQWLFDVEILARKNRVSRETEECTQKISWGLGQIMGALAREQGLVGPLPNLLNPQTNIEHVAIRIRDLKRISVNPTDVFAMYNGGPAVIKKNDENFIYKNQKYVDGVLKHMHDLS